MDEQRKVELARKKRDIDTPDWRFGTVSPKITEITQKEGPFSIMRGLFKKK